MSVKIFVIGDPHFKTNNVEETNEMSQKILYHIQRTNPDAVVCLGDVLDRHETIHVGPLQRSIDLFQKIAVEYPLFILIGNHDRPSNQVFLTEEHPFTALKLWKNTTIVDKVVEGNVKGVSFLFVPYVPPGRFQEAIETLVSMDQIQKYQCIFAHQEFKGAKMGIVESVVGDVWDESYPLVVSGHIHDFDELGSNIIYTGTPIQHAFGDNEDKGVFLFEFQDGAVYEKIDLQLPKKKIVKISCSEITSLKNLNPKYYYKIEISGTPEELKAIKLGPFLQMLPKSKIVYKTISTTKPSLMNLDFESKSFLELLYEELEGLEEQQELIETYCELFGMNKIAESRFVIVE